MTVAWEGGRRRPRDIELWEALLSKRKAQSCCGRRPGHDGTLGFDKSAREPRIHTIGGVNTQGPGMVPGWRVLFEVART